ncbi:MAG: LLM class flavin-dependent oxidoreductase [Deltaproteobacteria bacterium]|nr:MAG: LLM class flavin-dependent oxidoreductase [Deltaproteobacteria bacterium]
MEFGVMVATKIDDWQLIKYAEDLGYDRAWIPDSQMIWSDCYATLALAAHNTSRIRLGTGVAIPGTRIAPVTAHAIASINRIAPGRVFLGIGTGHTAMRVMGMQPMRIKEFREYLRVVRALLRGEEVEYTLDGVTRAIRFLHLDLGFINLHDPIPIYVAANGPLALRTVGEFGDGLISVFNEQPDVVQKHLRLVREGAERAGRKLPDTFHIAAVTTAMVLKPGEQLTSDRVINECGSQVMAALHFVYEIFQQTRREEVIPEAFKDIWEEYCAYVEKMETPPEKRYLQIHNGHCTFLVPAERRFVTPKAIQGTCLVGEPQQIIEQLRQAERMGLQEVSLLPPMEVSRKVFKDFAEQVIKHY